MPEGNFSTNPDDAASARTGIPRESRGVQYRRVLSAVQTREPSGQDAGSPALRMPKTIPEYFRIVRRRWRLIAGAAAVFAAIGAIVTWRTPTLYRAEAEILLDMRSVQVSDIKTAVPARPLDATMIRGEIEVLRSRALAERVAQQLHLTGQTGAAGIKAPDVQNDGRSFVLKINITADSPQLAADTANAYADLYLKHQVEAKNEATRRASEWLKKQIASLRDELVDSEQRINRYEEEHGISASRGTTVTAQELAAINAQLVAAHNDRVQKEGAVRYAKQMLESPGGADAAGQVLTSPPIQRLREQEADLRRRIAEMSTQYLPSHPTMIKMAAELDDLRHKTADEVNRVIRTMAEEANTARTREEALKANLAELAQSTGQQDNAQIRLRELEREADASRALYESLLARFKQTSTQEDIQQPDAQIISRSDAAACPPSPDKRRLLTTYAGLSVLGGVFIALVVELLDQSFRRSDEIEELTGLPVLGLVPLLQSRRPRKGLPHQAEAVLSEALREIRSGLRHAQAGAPIGVVLVTSSVEDEGKTLFAVALGRSVSRAGLRCLVIDCHFQRPGVGKLLSPAPARGAPAPTIATARYPQIEVDEVSGLHYIPAPALEQRRLFRSQDLFESNEMRTYIQRMRDHYDLVILDAPPAPAVADVIALSRLANTAIFLIRWGRTPRQAAADALRALALRGVNLAGIILSRVDLREYAAYGYEDYVRHLENSALAARGR